MLDHISITVTDIAAAERFYDAIMSALGVVKVGRREDWLGYGERARPAYPDRVYISVRKGGKPEEAFGRHWCFKAKWRMQVASEMLNRGNFNMATIAAEIGYESEAAFSRAFKKMTGVTPSAWRQGAR